MNEAAPRRRGSGDSAEVPTLAGRDLWREGPGELNARLLKPMLQFYELRRGREALAELAARLGTSLGVLEDNERWFAEARFAELNRAMMEELGDPELPYKAGREFVAPATLGPLRLGLLDAFSPRRVYELLPGYARRFARTGAWEVAVRGPGRATATYRSLQGATDDPTFCRNRVGSLEALPRTVDAPFARVEHPVCLHRGGPACVYELTWAEPPPWTGLSWLATGLCAAGGALGLFTGWSWAPTFLGAAAGLLAVSLSRSLSDTRRRTKDAQEVRLLVEAAERRVDELEATHHVADAIRGSLDETQLIAAVLKALCERLGYDRAAYLRVDDAAGELVGVQALGVTDPEFRAERLRFSLAPAGEDRRLFGHVLEDGEARLVRDVQEYSDHLLPRNRALLERLGTKGFVAAPVAWRGRRHGLLLVDRSRDRGELGVRDVEVLQSIAGSLGGALSSARLFEQLQEELLADRKFRQYLPAAVVDSIRKDPAAALELGGNRLDAAVMLCDIAGFTRMSADAGPEEVVRALNAWFSVTDPIIHRHRGIIDKRIGDGILVVFLEDGPEVSAGRLHPARRAWEAGVEMQEALEDARPRIGAVAPAFEQMEVRHAIHYGSVIAGNLGSEERMEHTIIGDAVNVCARLEEITPAGSVWLTGEALHAMGDEAPEAAREMAREQLRGRTTLTSAFEVVDDTLSQGPED